MKALGGLEDYLDFERARTAFEELENLGGATAAFGGSLSASEAAAKFAERLAHREWQPRDVREVSSEGEDLTLSNFLQILRVPHHGQSSPAGDEARRRVEDRAKIDALEGRIRKLEILLAELRAREGSAAPAELEAPVGAHTRWIESHLDELRKFPNSWVVLDAEKGILFHSADEAAFAVHLKQYAPGDRDRLMVFHTSMYV